MENKQFTSNNLDHSPHSSQSFQADRFYKKTTFLSIPDTIPENSAELSGDSLKMEASKTITDALNDEDKKNNSSNQTVLCNEALNTSSIISIDNSYIKQCERKLLENSNSEDDKSIGNKSLVDRHLLEVPRMSIYSNDTISTPPSALRKEISLLRNEMAEAHEFHDFEIQLLKEEKLQNETDSYNYSELISKYSALMELYTNLKTEYENYRVEQQQMRQEIQSKTADCLESLCSQIEASDNSLNVSSASFISFNGGIRSSTMLEDVTEVEATILHDATVLATDPLSITNDGVFKTPMQTPLKSVKKLFSQESNGKPIVREVKEIIGKRDSFDSEHNIHLLNLETALYDKKKEMENLEQRLFKIEDFSSVLQIELERITMENKTLRESLSDKTDQLNELTQKLFTETISLNPSLKASLVDIPGTKLLFVFIETIMESCRKIQAEETAKHNNKKLEWEAKSKADATAIENLKTQISSNLIEVNDLKKRLSDAENTILTRDEEILKLQSHVSNFKQTREDFATAREAISELESKLTLTEAEKTAAETRYRELEAVVVGLKREIETNKKILEEENSKMEKEKESHEFLKFELMTVKEKLTSAEEAADKLKSQIESIEAEKFELENRCTEFENILLQNNTLKQEIFETNKMSAELRSQIESLEFKKLELENRLTEFQTLQLENSELKLQIFEAEKTLVELKNRCAEFQNIQAGLKSQIESLECEKFELENRCSELSKNKIENDSIKQQILETEKTSTELKSHLESLKSKNSKLENRCAELENILIENENHKKQVLESDELIKRLKNELESLVSEKLNLENRCIDFQNIRNENENLKQQILDSEKMIKGLKTELEPLKCKNSDLENRFVELQSFQTENDNLKQKIFEIGKTSEELKCQLELLESEKLELKKHCSELETIRVENNCLKQQIFDSEKVKLENYNSELENARSENDSLKQRILEIEKASKELTSQLELLKSEKIDLRNRCMELESIQMENESQIFKIEKASAALENRCRELENFQSESEDLRQRLIEAENASAVLKSQLESLESEKLDLENRCSELKNIRMENDYFKQLIFENDKASATLKFQLKSLESEKRELENRCAELQRILTQNDSLKQQIFESQKLELENNNRELENFRIENENLKRQIFEAEKVMTELKTELELRRENEIKNMNKIEDLLREIELLKKHNVEVGEAVEETQSKITDLLLDCEFNSELPSERITKLVENSKFLEMKIVSVFVQTVRKTCEGVESELMRNFDSKKLEWEAQKNLLFEQVAESRNEKENLLKEKESQLAGREKEIKTLKEQYDEIKNQLEVIQNEQRELVENINREVEIKDLELATTQENLTSAEKTILMLKSQIKSFEVEKTQMENRYTELENNSNYEKIQTENDDLKERIFRSEKMLTELKNELDVAKEDQKNNIFKVEDLIREIEELKKENIEFSQAVEETRNLADVLSEDANDSDLPGDRITKLIAKTSKGEAKIVSDFVETISKTCKGVQNEMIRKFDSKKLEWENQKDVDLQNLHLQIQTLTEANKQLKEVVSQTKNELAVADEIIIELKSQLTSEKIKADAVENLKIEIDTKETIIKGLDEMKILKESENCCLIKQLQESEDVISRLKKRLTVAEGELNVKEAKMQELLKEVDSLRKEMEFVSQKLEKVEKSNRNLLEVLSEVQTHLNIPDDNLMDCENKKIFSEKMNLFVKAQLEGLETENKNLKIGNENLKEEIKQLTKLIGEAELKNANVSHPNSRTKVGKNMDLCVRRLDKLEEINHNLTELLTRVLTMIEFADLEKLKLCSVREFPSLMKKVIAHVNGLLGKMKEMKEENGQLDEECETYSNIIKDLKKEAAAVWKDNKEKMEAFEAEIGKLKEEKNFLEKEKEELAGKISKLNEENLKLKSRTEGTLHTCTCGNESKKINELKRAILVKEQKLLELQDLEAQTSSYKSQIEYLKTALEREKKKIGEEKEKNKKLQNELKEAGKHQKTEENQVLDELRMRGSISGGIVQEFVDKEKMKKLSKDIGILKELCRARYAEIKRLEAMNAALRSSIPKNSNQMDSPIHSRAYNTRSKNQVRDFWKTAVSGKENSAV